MADDDNILHIPTKIHLGDALNGLLFLAGIALFGMAFSSWMSTGDPLGFLKRMRWSNAAYESYAADTMPEPPVAIPPFSPYGGKSFAIDPDYFNYGRRRSPGAQLRRRAARAAGVPANIPAYRGLASYTSGSPAGDYGYYDYRAFQRSQIPYPPMYENEYDDSANAGYLPGEISNDEDFTITRDKYGRITGGHTKRHVREGRY